MAGQADNKKIIIGAASFFVGVAEGKVALPALTPGATKADALIRASVDWRDIGYTQEGVEVSYEPDFGEVEVDQLLDSARIFKQSMRVTVNTTLAEATLENLLIVWGQNAASLVANVLDIEAGELGDAPEERSLAFVGPAPRIASDPAQRIYHVTRAIQTESSSHALRRSEATALPVSFRLLPDDTEAKSRYGTVRDRAVTA